MIFNLNFKNKWLIWENKCVSCFSISHHVVTNLVRICDHFLLMGQAYDCPSNTSCRLLCNSWSMLFFFQMMTLLEFAFKDTGPATRVTGSVCTCQTRSACFFAAPVFHWKFRSLCFPSFSVLVHSSVSTQTVQTERSHLGKLGALNENWWQISH